MDFQPLLLILIAIPNILLGSFILARNSDSKTNLSFAGIALAGGFWSLGLCAFILTDSTSAAIWWAKLYYTAAALIALFFLIFSALFTNTWRSKLTPKLVLPLLGFTIVTLTIFTPGVLIEGIRVHTWGKEVILDTVGYSLYSLYFIGAVAAGFTIIYRSLRKATGLFRIYLRFLFSGLILAFTLGGTFNLIYPALGNYRYIWVGPLFTVTYISLVSYAIIKHRLFDIRLVVARTVAYILLLTTLSLIFAAGVFASSSLLLNHESLDNGTRITFTVMAIVLAFAFQPLKRFFDRVTNDLFYRDAYDPQELLNNLNSSLIATVGVDDLLKKSAAIIRHTLKSEFCTFWLTGKGNTASRWIGSNNTKDIDEELEKAILGLPNKATITDDLQPRFQHHKDILQNHGIALVLQLGGKSTIGSHMNGYMVVGHKLSGGLFSKQDINTLGIISKEIVIAIQNALRFEEIEQFNVTLQQKIDDATKQLKRANQKLKEIDEAKDEFVSMASHQLRTPLTVIKGYLSMLLEGDMGKVTKQQKETIQTAFDGAERMVFLIGDLLNVSRLQTGKFQIENKLTDLAAVISHEVEHLQESAANHQLKLIFDKPKNFPSLMVDETKIRQVIMNFIDNAIYYTPAGGSITVILEQKNKSIEFTVNDTGLGVPKSEQHHLFSKFYRAGNARKMRPDGTGLGLYMAKKIVIAQGGAIIFKSEEGKGSTFGFNLPIHTA